MFSMTARVCARMSRVVVPISSTVGAGDGVVRPAAAGAGDEDEVAGDLARAGTAPRGTGLARRRSIEPVTAPPDPERDPAEARDRRRDVRAGGRAARRARGRAGQEAPSRPRQRRSRAAASAAAVASARRGSPRIAAVEPVSTTAPSISSTTPVAERLSRPAARSATARSRTRPAEVLSATTSARVNRKSAYRRVDDLQRRGDRGDREQGVVDGSAGSTRAQQERDLRLDPRVDERRARPRWRRRRPASRR